MNTKVKVLIGFAVVSLVGGSLYMTSSGGMKGSLVSDARRVVTQCNNNDRLCSQKNAAACRTQASTRQMCAEARAKVTAATKDTTAPTVLSQTPAGGSMDVPLNVSVTLTFSEPMDSTTISATTVQLKKYTNSATVQSTITPSADGTTVTVTPLSPLLNDTKYYISVANVTDLAGGNALTNTYGSAQKDQHQFTTTAPAWIVSARQNNAAAKAALESGKTKATQLLTTIASIDSVAVKAESADEVAMASLAGLKESARMLNLQAQADFTNAQRIADSSVTNLNNASADAGTQELKDAKKMSFDAAEGLKSLTMTNTAIADAVSRAEAAVLVQFNRLMNEVVPQGVRAATEAKDTFVALVQEKIDAIPELLFFNSREMLDAHYQTIETTYGQEVVAAYSQRRDLLDVTKSPASLASRSALAIFMSTGGTDADLIARRTAAEPIWNQIMQLDGDARLVWQQWDTVKQDALTQLHARARADGDNESAVAEAQAALVEARAAKDAFIALVEEKIRATGELLAPADYDAASANQQLITETFNMEIRGGLGRLMSSGGILSANGAIRIATNRAQEVLPLMMFLVPDDVILARRLAAEAVGEERGQLEDAVYAAAQQWEAVKTDADTTLRGLAQQFRDAAAAQQPVSAEPAVDTGTSTPSN